MLLSGMEGLRDARFLFLISLFDIRNMSADARHTALLDISIAPAPAHDECPRHILHCNADTNDTELKLAFEITLPQ